YYYMTADGGKSVYVADSRILPDEVEKLKQCCDSILVNHHKEYDFGSYKRGFGILKDLNVLDKCESLLIANDSVDFVGNSEDLSDVFEKSSKYEAFGLCTASFGFGKRIKRHKYEWIKYPHLQSYFIVMKKDVFGSQWFADFMKSIIRIKRKRQIIIRYEMGLSGMLREHGVSMGSYYPYDETNIVNPYAIYLNEFTEKPLFIKHKVKCC
ncbi:MAG: rhamnan synthesis F family protein, partial [Succinivibrio sp.]